MKAFTWTEKGSGVFESQVLQSTISRRVAGRLLAPLPYITSRSDGPVQSGKVDQDNADVLIVVE